MTKTTQAQRWQALEQDLRREVDGEVHFDAGTRALYDCDASNYRHIPIGVVIPRTTDAVIAAVAACRRHDAPLLSRGGGTGLAGQTCNEAVVLDFSKYMNRIIDIDPEAKTARVQPGVILDDLRREAARYDLTYGPDPATHTHNTFGGMLGNNSCGIHSVMAGRTADNTIEMDVLTYDGVRMTVGATDEAELARIIEGGGRRGEIYAGMKRIRDQYADLIRERYPDIPRRVSGYNLDDLLAENGFQVARTLTGSEGTLVTILEATVRLVYRWPGRALLVLGYPDVYAAGDDIPQIMAHEPVGLEGLDEKLIDFNERKDMNLNRLDLLPKGGGWLLVEMGGHDLDEAREKARQLAADLKQRDNPPNIKLFSDPGEEQQVWEIRESGLGATANVPGEALAWPGWEDAAVPPDRVGDYLRRFRSLMDEFGLDAALYGHFGQGCIHCRITFDLFTRDGIRQYRAFIDRAADLVAEYGGSFSGEHGDGQARGLFLERMYGKELVGAFHDLKALWDPAGRMNPHKIIDADAPDSDLRLGPDYRPAEHETFFRFPDDQGSFARATLRCVGVGKCRRTEDAFMCPSFLATRDEKDCTRGRAHALFEMFRGDFIDTGWHSDEVRDTLDLCLSCRACKSECPVDVDMAVYKMEFLHHHYRRRLRPRHHYALGLIGYAAPWGSQVPGLMNRLGQGPLAPLLKGIMGTAQDRPLPRFAEQTFWDWFKGHRQPVGADAAPVLLYPDLFTNIFEPDVLKAAVAVLNHCGRRVLLPRKPPPEVLPLMHFGFLGLAGRHLGTAIDLLLPFARQQMPILFVEPSVAAVFVEDLPKIRPDDSDAQQVVGQCRTLADFLLDSDAELPSRDGRAIVHTHCNQKAVLNGDAVNRLVAGLGLDVEVPEQGCCGMAGSFGYVKAHNPVSLRIAERNLLPAVREADAETLIVADGFSCRSQIRDGSEREPMHSAVLLQRLIDGAGGG